MSFGARVARPRTPGSSLSPACALPATTMTAVTNARAMEFRFMGSEIDCDIIALMHFQQGNFTLRFSYRLKEGPTPQTASGVKMRPAFPGLVATDSIRQSADAAHPVKGRVPADDRFPVAAGKTGQPVVVLAQASANANQFPVHVRCRVHHTRSQTVDGPFLEVFPRYRRIGKRNRNLTQVDDGSPYPGSGPVLGEKYPGWSMPFGRAFSQKMDQESGVRDHFRPPDRRPRSFNILCRMSGSTFGGGWLSCQSKSSPFDLAGTKTCRRRTLLN